MADKNMPTPSNAQTAEQLATSTPSPTTSGEIPTSSCPIGQAWLFCVCCGAPSSGRPGACGKCGARVCIGCGE